MTSRTNRKTEISSAEKRVRMEKKTEQYFSDRRKGTRGRQSDCALKREQGTRKRRNDVSGFCKRYQRVAFFCKTNFTLALTPYSNNFHINAYVKVVILR